MRRLATLSAIFCTFLPTYGFPQAGIRIEWPWGGEFSLKLDNVVQLLTDPISLFNPTGIPMTGDLIGSVSIDPDGAFKIVSRPDYIAYTPVISAINSGRNAILVNGAQPIPTEVRDKLSGFFPREILDSVRWSTNWNILQNSPSTLQFFFDKDTNAITLVNAVVFRKPSYANDIGLWAHELHHVMQYRQLGIFEFAKRWTDNSSINGPIEAPAYQVERDIRNFFASYPEIAISNQTWCFSKSSYLAYCDVFASVLGGNKTFVVSGEARATSDGTRNGRMALVMGAGREICNTGGRATVMVDNATQLSGPDYQCSFTLPPGGMQRVIMLAPNSHAEAGFIRGTISIK